MYHDVESLSINFSWYITQWALTQLKFSIRKGVRKEISDSMTLIWWLVYSGSALTSDSTELRQVTILFVCYCNAFGKRFQTLYDVNLMTRVFGQCIDLWCISGYVQSNLYRAVYVHFIYFLMLSICLKVGAIISVDAISPDTVFLENLSYLNLKYVFFSFYFFYCTRFPLFRFPISLAPLARP